MSEYGKASWHASGSVKQRTLLHATSALPKNKTTIWRATSVIGRSMNLRIANGGSDRSFILAPLILPINVPILMAATLPNDIRWHLHSWHASFQIHALLARGRAAGRTIQAVCRFGYEAPAPRHAEPRYPLARFFRIVPRRSWSSFICSKAADRSGPRGSRRTLSNILISNNVNS